MRTTTREKNKRGASRTKKAIAAAIIAAAAVATASTAVDPHWTPFAVTAPDPSYPGAHSTISEAAATVLGAFDGQRVHLAITVNGVTRTFGSFQAAANEAGLSRIWAGQHTVLDHQAGERPGGRLRAEPLHQRARLARRYVRGGRILGPDRPG
jgi:hypothetical protein